MSHHRVPYGIQVCKNFYNFRQGKVGTPKVMRVNKGGFNLQSYAWTAFHYTHGRKYESPKLKRSIKMAKF